MSQRHSSSRSNIPSTPTNTKDLTKDEVYQKLEEANETMKAYYSYPPDKVIQMKKARFNDRHRDSSFFIQLGLGMCILTFQLSILIVVERSEY